MNTETTAETITASDAVNAAANAQAAADALKAETRAALDRSIEELEAEYRANEARAAEINDRLKALKGSRENAKKPIDKKKIFKRVAIGVLAIGTAAAAGVAVYRRMGSGSGSIADVLPDLDVITA